MNDERTHLTTVTHHFETDPESDVDIDPAEVDVYADVEPPEDLADAVHAALDRTIAHLLDGREVVWQARDDGDGFLLVFPSGIPEMPVGPGEWVAPYRTREQFEGADGSGDGLLDNLPGDWTFDLKNSGTYVFYQD